MAPKSYAAVTDIECLINSNAELSAPQSPSWKTYVAGIVGVCVGVCAGLLFLHETAPQATELRVMTQTRAPGLQNLANPVQAPEARSTAVAKKNGPNLLQKVGTGLAGLGLATMANLGTPDVTLATEGDLLYADTPTIDYVYDNGAFLSKSTVNDLSAKLPDIEARTGYRINVVTLRKLVASDDAFQFADKLIEAWYPTAELGSKKAIFVLVKQSKEGGLVGGPSFSQTVPGSVIESIMNDNVNYLAGEEKFNQAITSSISRLDAVLSGKADPGPPKASLLSKPKDKPEQVSNYKTKEETTEKKNVYVFVFGALVLISFVAPMAQFFSYTDDKQ
jgi:uncharacterized membrane protein YgcG|eukprot:CAMPEP_0174294770 /NCGR_PEP_ID=MMETSP0809-20121228/42575_1 /TAXON_ID=73025 ORGANISM="Eutreptiella gymnastica-like, Strain CCMP1594" /NCGR_SAMPLE_ID=MMETSP0809 /ASSEMBLY_ACC=CAM_ASM_000658 /LENGTH=333 /DNA_ID=CAMNT_0015396467 /DNA_START=39 /DNA_END=1040 /DNA_ORIENTATION=+